MYVNVMERKGSGNREGVPEEMRRLYTVCGTGNERPCLIPLLLVTTMRPTELLAKYYDRHFPPRRASHRIASSPCDKCIVPFMRTRPTNHPPSLLSLSLFQSTFCPSLPGQRIAILTITITSAARPYCTTLYVANKRPWIPLFSRALVSFHFSSRVLDFLSFQGGT